MTYSEDVLRLNPELIQATVPASKYKNVRAEAKGLRFQSGHEASEIGKLIIAEEHHLIFGLRLQYPFPLQGGNKYIADAVYLELVNGRLEIVVADAKGFKTKEYKIKKKLFKEMYGIEIREM